MKTTRLILVLASFFALASTSRAAAQCTPGPHSGTITADQTWCAVDSPHAFSGAVTVAAGVTLTIEAGSLVNATTFTIFGRLVTLGTAANPITFTGSTGTASSSTAVPAGSSTRVSSTPGTPTASPRRTCRPPVWSSTTRRSVRVSPPRSR